MLTELLSIGFILSFSVLFCCSGWYLFWWLFSDSFKPIREIFEEPPKKVFKSNIQFKKRATVSSQAESEKTYKQISQVNLKPEIYNFLFNHKRVFRFYQSEENNKLNIVLIRGPNVFQDQKRMFIDDLKTHGLDYILEFSELSMV